MASTLQVATPLSPTPQPVADQTSSNSGLYLTNATTATVSVPARGHIVFGIPGDPAGGVGEWIQNSRTAPTNPAWGLAFVGASVERMRITNAGQVGIGTTNPTATLTVNGGVTIQGLNTSTLTLDVTISPTGNLGVQTSSARFKENIRELTDDFRKVLGLRPVAFDYKDSGEHAIGYVAEEVAAQGLDHLVVHDGEGKPFSVAYKLIPIYLLELVKQQQTLIEKLQETVAAVEQRFAGLHPQPAG